MADSQPTRPPRITRSSSKDASGGLLMSMIRTLTASRDPNDRNREKTNLEREYRDSDARLSQLVSSHHSDLSQVMSAFSKISQRLKHGKERVVTTREKLQTCMKLLHCKRDELKKLWLESVENKVVLELLDQVEALMMVPQDVSNFINKKHYLHATKLLMSSLSQLDGSLIDVEALKEVKSELISKKESLYDILIDDLHKHIYLKSTADLIKKFKRQGSGRRAGDATPVRKMSVADILSAASSGANRKRSSSLTRFTGIEPIEENLNLSDPEEDGKHFIAILIECLGLLNKIPEAIESIKEKCERELVNIVKRTGRELISDSVKSMTMQHKSVLPIVLQSSHVLGENSQSQRVILFQDFLELVFQQLRAVVQMHETVVLVQLRRLEEERNEVTAQIYSLAEIWSKIQTTLQLVVDLYLDMSGANSDKSIQNLPQESGGLANVNPTVADLSNYFAKRRGIGSVSAGLKMKKTSLFRFDSSSHAMSLNAYLQEQKEAMKEKAELNGTTIDSIDLSLNHADQYMVCQPAAENIVLMFNPTMKFIEEIEEELQLEEGNHCPLHSHLHSCAKMFCNQVNIELERMLEMANKSLDIWKVTADPDTLASLKLSRPLLQSTIMVARAIFDLKNLMFALPIYADEILNLICNVLSNYKETCLAAYRGIVQPEPEDKRIISATWAKDEDINRFLKSLPNWLTLQGVQAEGIKKGAHPHIRMLSQESKMTFDESPEEVRLRNMRESEILTSNLAQDTLIPVHEILSDVGQLRVLAQLQESMEWLGKRCDELANELPSSSDGGFLAVSNGKSANQPNVELAPLSDVSIATLNQLSTDFEELAETCLLVLHLEVRVHCFYFLLPVANQGSFAMGIDTQEPDPDVIRFNKDLAGIDEAMGIALHPAKLRYIFEGLGHLIATILINSASTIKRINSNGVKKMCRNIFTIQQSLTSVTMTREVALDYAKQFFELFYHTPEEILAIIVERGPQFQLNEYTSAIQLLHRSLSGREPHQLETSLKRLQEILSEVAVAL